MNSFTMSPLALAKIVMHACKYPHAAVNGVLLAERPPQAAVADSGNAASPTKAASGQSSTKLITIVDAIPLFHSNLSLAPMLEAALMQIEAACGESRVIAGYYQANELLGATSPEGVGAQIYHKIADNCNSLPRCLFVLVDNARISRDCETAPLLYYQRREPTGTSSQHHHRLDQLPASAVAIDNEAESLAQLSSLLHNQAYRRLVDFDNHLDDIALDWANPGLADMIGCAS